MTALKTAVIASACVIGSMDLVRPLGSAGVSCALVTRPDDPAGHSRYVDCILERSDPIEEPEVLTERLTSFASQQKEKPVLYYEGDGGLIFASRNREELSDYFRFLLPAADLIEIITDKTRFYPWAEQLNLPVPATESLTAGQDDPNDLELRYPLIVKPAARQVHRVKEFGAAKAMLVNDPDDAKRLLDQLGPTGMTFVFQEHIPGPENQIESYHAYFDRRGRLVTDFTGRKIRTSPHEFGQSTALITTDARDLLVLGREIAERLGLFGVMKFDFKRGADGKLWLLEVNPRFSLWHDLGERAGVNIPALVHGDLTGWARPAYGAVRSGVRWCRPLSDFRVALRAGELGPSWFLETIASKACTLSLSDPGFLWAALCDRIRRWCAALSRRVLAGYGRL